MTDTTPTSNAGQPHRLVKPIDAKLSMQMEAGHLARTGHQLVAHLVSTDGGDIWRIERPCCDLIAETTSNAGHREPAKQREYARLPNHGQGTYAHDKVTAQDAADHYAKTGTTYVVSGDQSLRAHGYLGMRRAGGPGRRLVGRSRFAELVRTMIVSGRLPHPLTVDELTRLGLTTQE
jgi:hypothetical protein